MAGKSRTDHRPAAGGSLVEFSLVAPLGLLLLFGMIVLGVVIKNEVALTNAVRDGARGAAICGSQTASPPLASTPSLPDGTPCSDANVTGYLNHRLSNVDSSLSGSATITVYDATGTLVGTTAEACRPGYTLEVHATYQQPLFLPLIGYLLGNPSTNTRTLDAKGEATCEQ